MNDFDHMSESFTAAMLRAAQWKHGYFGATYARRIKSAIADAKRAIAIAEANPEIGFVEPTK